LAAFAGAGTSLTRLTFLLSIPRPHNMDRDAWLCAWFFVCCARIWGATQNPMFSFKLMR
jgi:hypothetical protein